MRISYLIPNGSGEFVERKLEDLIRDKPRIALVNVEGEYHFAAVDEMQLNLEKILDTNIKILILRIRGIRHLTSTGVTALDSLIENAQSKGTKIIICGATDKVEVTLNATGIITLIGEQQEFKASETLLKSTRLALDRTNQIVNSDNPDTE